MLEGSRQPRLSRREPKVNIREADIRAVYQEGEEATVLLVKSLLAWTEVLEECLDKLEDQQEKDSYSSSKPPSENRFKRRTKSLYQKSDRSIEGQKGYLESTLEWCEAVDELVKHTVEVRESYGASLTGAATTEHEMRQAHRLSPIRLQPIEHQAEIKCCKPCDWLIKGQFHSEVTSSLPYLTGLKGLTVYSIDRQLLPSAKVCEVFSEVLGRANAYSFMPTKESGF